MMSFERNTSNVQTTLVHFSEFYLNYGEDINVHTLGTFFGILFKFLEKI